MTASTFERNGVRSRPSTRPAHRPPLALRGFVGLLAAGAAIFNVALMWSDRAPGLAERIFGDFAVRLSERLNGAERIGTITDGRRPGNDAIVHIGVWSVAMLLVGLAIWRWAPLIVAAFVLFLGSVAVEIGQGRYSTSRAVETSDVFANGVGVALGVAGSAACYLAWSAAASVVGRLRAG